MLRSALGEASALADYDTIKKRLLGSRYSLDLQHGVNFGLNVQTSDSFTAGTLSALMKAGILYKKATGSPAEKSAMDSMEVDSDSGRLVVKFKADEWVRTAKDAGMKYIVITSKHHDGFAMFHSQASRWNITDATPFGRDPIKELAAACKKQGLKLGFYYSQAQDWNHPGGAAYGEHWDKAQDGDFSVNSNGNLVTTGGQEVIGLAGVSGYEVRPAKEQH